MSPSEQDYLDAREACRRQLDGNQVDASSALMSPRELCRYHTARWRTLNDVLALWRAAVPDNAPAPFKVFEAALHCLEVQANEAQHHAGLAWRKHGQDKQDAQAETASQIVPKQTKVDICAHALRWMAVNGASQMWERPICFHDEIEGLRDVNERQKKGRP